jgi:hypothetical protein
MPPIPLHAGNEAQLVAVIPKGVAIGRGCQDYGEAAWRALVSVLGYWEVSSRLRYQNSGDAPKLIDQCFQWSITIYDFGIGVDGLVRFRIFGGVSAYLNSWA